MNWNPVNLDGSVFRHAKNLYYLLAIGNWMMILNSHRAMDRDKSERQGSHKGLAKSFPLVTIWVQKLDFLKICHSKIAYIVVVSTVFWFTF